MTKGKTLQDRLAHSLDQANKKDQAALRQTPAPIQTGGKCTKLSISLFDADMKRLDAIRSFMAQHGSMISKSQAVKIALRTAPLSDALVKALDQAKKEDGRGNW